MSASGSVRRGSGAFVAPSSLSPLFPPSPSLSPYSQSLGTLLCAVSLPPYETWYYEPSPSLFHTPLAGDSLPQGLSLLRRPVGWALLPLSPLPSPSPSLHGHGEPARPRSQGAKGALECQDFCPPPRAFITNALTQQGGSQTACPPARSCYFQGFPGGLLGALESSCRLSKV